MKKSAGEKIKHKMTLELYKFKAKYSGSLYSYEPVICLGIREWSVWKELEENTFEGCDVIYDPSKRASVAVIFQRRRVKLNKRIKGGDLYLYVGQYIGKKEVVKAYNEKNEGKNKIATLTPEEIKGGALIDNDTLRLKPAFEDFGKFIETLLSEDNTKKE